MADVAEIRCYIEEYPSAPRVLGLRLREKATGRSVVLGSADGDEKQQLIQFLLAGRAHREALPALFDPSDPADCVLVSGRLQSVNSETITFVFDNTLSYGFA